MGSKKPKRQYQINAMGSNADTDRVAEYIAKAQDLPYTHIDKDNIFQGHNVWNNQRAQFAVHREGDIYEIIPHGEAISIESVLKLSKSLGAGEL